jgi:Golgi nucleoside diphosphatase
MAPGTGQLHYLRELKTPSCSFVTDFFRKSQFGIYMYVQNMELKEEMCLQLSFPPSRSGVSPGMGAGCVFERSDLVLGNLRK